MSATEESCSSISRRRRKSPHHGRYSGRCSKRRPSRRRLAKQAEKDAKTNVKEFEESKMASFADVPLDVMEKIIQRLEPRDMATFHKLSRKCFTAATRVRIPVEGIEYIEQANWANSIMVKVTGGYLAGFPTTEFDYPSEMNRTIIVRKKYVKGECLEDNLYFDEPTSLMEVAVKYLWEVLEIYKPNNLTIWLTASELGYATLSKVLAGNRLAVCDNLKIRGRDSEVISDLLPYITAGSIDIGTFYYAHEANSQQPCSPSRTFLRKSKKSVRISGCALRDSEVSVIRCESMDIEICCISARTVEIWIKDFYADRSDRLKECSIRSALITEKQVAALNKKYQRVRKTYTDDNGDVLMEFVFTLNENISQRLVISRTDAAYTEDTYSIRWEPVRYWNW